MLAYDQLLYNLASKKNWEEVKRMIPIATASQINYYNELIRWTPLHWACGDKAPVEVVRLLIEKGAKVDVLDRSDSTPLHVACLNNASVEVVRLLVRHGANLDALDKNLWTPLHVACLYNAPMEVVQLFLESGANAALMDKYGKTPLDYETRPEVTDMVHLYLQRYPSKKSASATSSSASISPFFLELFTRASISDLGEQRDYSQKLLKEKITTPEKLIRFTIENLRAFGIPAGDADSLLEAVRVMLHPPSTTPSAPSLNKESLVTKSAVMEMPLLRYPFLWYFFASHNWGTEASGFHNHARVRSVVEYFSKLNGKSVWFDNERLKGDIADQVSSGIEQSVAFVVFVTQQYVDKLLAGPSAKSMDWCHYEFNHAMTHKKTRMITVVMEEEMMRDKLLWKGRIGMLAQTMHIDFTSDDKLESCVHAIAVRISEVLSESE